MSTWTFIASLVSATGLGGIIVALIAWRRFAPQDKQKTAKLAAETRSIDADTYTKLLNQINKLSDRIEQQDGKIDDLERTIIDQGREIAKLQQRNHDLGAAMRTAVIELLAWIRRALSVMTPAQQADVGEPPDYEHLIALPERT